jgi:predicted O-linked N-acetylglucosamine transferase (SPINDLY family)
MQGMIAQLSRETFSVTVLSIGEHHDELAEAIRKSADEYVVLPTTPKRAREIVAACKLDVLFYADIGMDAWSYSLAFNRLARVQCVTWGHPVSTGIPNIDYFISSELLEPDDADGHYTENLVRLAGLPTYYYRPAAPAQSRDRASYSIPEGGHLYLCPQSLFKFHPEFDVLLKEILRRDPQGRLILVEGIEPAWTEKLRDRFRQNLGLAADRVQFLPRQGRDEFLNLMRLCDVMLDPLHFGGGNTTYEALALGVPIVTLPSPYMRGRVTAACYRKMGLDDCIAGSPREYVDLAVRLATDPECRKSFSTRIVAANHVLYEDRQSLHELEDFLQMAVERARGGREARREQAAATDNSRAAMPAVSEMASTIAPSALVDLLREATCPACGHHVAVPFYDGGEQPLATVAWPQNAADARSMKRLPLEFLRCVDCGHV